MCGRLSVDCIHPKADEDGADTADQLFIDPVECIDCGACVPVCPVSAIFGSDDLPEKWGRLPRKERIPLRPLTQSLPLLTHRLSAQPRLRV